MPRVNLEELRARVAERSCRSDHGRTVHSGPKFGRDEENIIRLRVSESSKTQGLSTSQIAARICLGAIAISLGFSPFF